MQRQVHPGILRAVAKNGSRLTYRYRGQVDLLRTGAISCRCLQTFCFKR